MKASVNSLRSLLQENVCEIQFVRRRQRANRPPFRRMLCTLDEKILNSPNGRLSLNFMPSTGILPYNASQRNLLPVWDIFMQGWRMVSLDDCNVINTIKEDEFWKYFNDTLLPMSPEQKMVFMDS